MKDTDFGAIPTHPGEVIKDEIEYRGISQRRLAKEIGISYTALNEILNGKRSLSPNNAYLFEAALDIPATSLMKLQMRYDLQTARINPKLIERLASIRRIASVL